MTDGFNRYVADSEPPFSKAQITGHFGHRYAQIAAFIWPWMKLQVSSTLEAKIEVNIQRYLRYPQKVGFGSS
jgi:hypothetical protein